MEASNISKITVFGPGIVGMPMAALLADSCRKGAMADGAFVQVIQRNSVSSGWKTDMINKGESPIGGIEPGLNECIAACVKSGALKASYDYMDAVDSDLIIVAVQTDKKGLEPDYGPMMAVMEQVTEAVAASSTKPVVISESTLAPTTINTILKPMFEAKGLMEGEHVFLGISPNRVMPGLLLDRIQHSDKLIGCINEQAAGLVKSAYSTMNNANLYVVNAITAESVKTTENCYRDVLVAFATEIARICDEKDYDFNMVRAAVNDALGHSDEAGVTKNVVPEGALLFPTTGVGGHCLPKDGVLLSWRYNADSGKTANMIITSREINDYSPVYHYEQAKAALGEAISGKAAVLGAAYLFNSDDTRNSPALTLSAKLLEEQVEFQIHDPYVRHEDDLLNRHGLTEFLSDDLDAVLAGAEVVFIATGHQLYHDELLSRLPDSVKVVVDGCRVIAKSQEADLPFKVTGIGRGNQQPPDVFLMEVERAYHVLQWGFAKEVASICAYYDETYLQDQEEFGRLHYERVRELVNTCPAGRYMVSTTDQPAEMSNFNALASMRLLKLAQAYES